MAEPRVGLAVSGGGFRATCFGLGCMRALHDRGLLPRLSVISGISGGSLLTALYAYGPETFGPFDDLAVRVLSSGLQLDITKRALHPKALARSAAHGIRAFLPRDPETPISSANRSDALRNALADRYFGSTKLGDLTHPNLATVITATDLRTSNAVRFGSARSSCSAYGIIQEPVTVAEAVAASAAFPLLLPTIERTYTFSRGPGQPKQRPVKLTDGGVYDNLGLSVLEPGRSTAHTAHVYDLDYVIACDAGRGRLPLATARFMTARMRRSYDVTYHKAQDAARGRLHEAAADGRLRGFVHAYLGMPDNRLPTPVADLVPADDVREYPTNFCAMTAEDLQSICLRGEQLTRALVAHYLPEL